MSKARAFCQRSPARSPRRVLLALLVAVGCVDSYDPTSRSSARLIDRDCQSGSYELSGSAQLTVGLSDDSCAFVLGPEPGSVTVPSATSMLLWTDDPAHAEWRSTGPTISNPPGTTWHVIDLREEVTELSPGCGGPP
jgi:hypothetical protein